jgi:hypothetical protein
MSNNNAVDAAVQAAEIETSGKRTRAGTKRDVIYKAVPAGTQVFEHKMSGSDWSETQAIEVLKGLAGADCNILGPYYIVKGAKSESESISVKVSLRDHKPTAQQYEGTHRGWTFFANGIKQVIIDGEHFADNDLLDIEFESATDSNSKQAKPRFPKGMLIRRSSIDNCIAVE